MNAAARLVFSASRYDQIIPLLHRLHWLRPPQRISFKLALLAFRCLRGLAPTYLSDSLRHVADLPGRQVCVLRHQRILLCHRHVLKQSVIERSVLRRQKPGTVFRQK